MSSEFVPGQNARAIRETLSESGTKVVKNAQVTVEAYFGGTQFMARLEGDTGLIFYTADFEPVEPTAPYPATPAPSLLDQDGDDDGREAAPLDPKSVHVGDTVTVRFKETGDEIVTKAYQPDDITASGEYVYLLGWPLHRANGTFGLAFSHFEILAIEPAPRPESAWKPGTVGTATIRDVKGVRGVWATLWGGEPYFAILEADKSGTGSLSSTAEHVTDFVPDEPRPLPTREQVAEAIVRGTETAPGACAGTEGFRIVSPTAAATRVLELLDGAS